MVECYIYMYCRPAKASNKKPSYMNISHYLVGLWFYTTFNYLLYKQDLLQYTPPCLWMQSAGLVLFFLFEIDQFVNHYYLSTLHSYAYPRKFLFQYVYCPHYFDEIMIYTGLMLYSGIPIIEKLCVVGWVAGNLGMSALNNKKYYMRKYKDEKVKWAIIVGVL
ncbi:hypothetical protein ACO0RG_004111 [Hanseniaspora osmophila]